MSVLLAALYFTATEPPGFGSTERSLNSLNDQIASFMVTGPKTVEQEEHAFIPPEKETLQKSMTLMRHLLVDAQATKIELSAKILKMMDDNKQLAQRIDGAIQSASQEVTNLRSELSATSRRLAELGATDSSASMVETLQHNHNGVPDGSAYGEARRWRRRRSRTGVHDSMLTRSPCADRGIRPPSQTEMRRSDERRGSGGPEIDQNQTGVQSTGGHVERKNVAPFLGSR
ncbi:hypothetical protein INR49_022380, partial [Caranx melampygus]